MNTHQAVTLLSRIAKLHRALGRLRKDATNIQGELHTSDYLTNYSSFGGAQGPRPRRRKPKFADVSNEGAREQYPRGRRGSNWSAGA